MSLRSLVAALGEARRYPHPVERVETIETHISFVLLAGEYAYKLKKPLELGFLDYGTLAKRRAACEEELLINRRTAPGLYLALVPIGGTPEEPCLGLEPAIEWAVQMRRFPQEDLALRRVASARLTAAEMVAFAGDLARFHAAAPAAPAGSAFGSPESVLAPARDNLTTLEDCAALQDEREVLAELSDWTRGEGARLTPLFTARQHVGRVREGHGDLHLGNLVFLGGALVPFDGIEFAPELRWIDVASEIAFLAMDLLDHGEPALAHAFVDAYVEAAGDPGALAVLPFYLVYRALVRAKVAALRAQGSAEPARARAEAEARRYLALAARLSRPRPRALVLMHGLSGSGKSGVAARIVARTGAVRLRSDVERKRLSGLGPGARTGSPGGGGLYARGASDATYARLRELAGEVLAAGFAVVVDATCLQRARRSAFRELARARGVPFLLVSCRAAPEELARRVAARARLAEDPSEAGPEVLAAQLASQEPLEEPELGEALVLDTDSTPARTEAALEAALARVHLV
jgi:uncharacterized protein